MDTTFPTVRYPDIEVKLIGLNGNAFAIIGRVREAMRKAKLPYTEITKFTTEATTGDYNHLLVTCMNWVRVY